MGQAVRLGLRARIALVVGAVMTITTAAVVGATAIGSADSLEGAMQSRSLAVAKSIRIQLDRLLALGLTLENLSGFEDQLKDAVRTYEGVSHAFVVNREGMILFHNDKAHMGKPVGTEAMGEASGKAEESVVQSMFQERKVVTTLIPLYNRSGLHIGGVAVGFPSKLIESRVGELVGHAVAIGAVVFIAGMALLLGALSVFVTRPLTVLTEAVDSIRSGAGNFSVRVKGQGAGEIGVLIDGFNRMLDHIQRRDRQLVSLEELKRSEASLAYAQRLARVGNWEWKGNSPPAHWSPEVYRILDVEPRAEGPTFDSFLLRVPEAEREEVRAAFHALLRGDRTDVEHRIVTRNGVERVVYQQAETVRENGRVVLVRGTIQDVTERKSIEIRMRDLAYCDSLTGLPNRTMFKEQLAAALRNAGCRGEQVAVMFLDLDRFKQVNDSLGHRVGDGLLKAVADRLSACLRGGDTIGHHDAGDGDVIARLGGDEFTVMLTRLAGTGAAAAVARRIVAAMARPLTVEGHELFVTASVGLAMFPDDGGDIDTLLKNADAAMYCAKAAGRNTYSFYSSEHNSRALERLELEGELHRALERGELSVHYQVQVDAGSGHATGAEALLRWRHPRRGMVPPAQFIPIAEQSGLIVSIGDWVLREACRQAKAWAGLTSRPLPIAVNVSGAQFRNGHLVGAVRGALEACQLHPSLLVVEATESILLEDVAATQAALQELRAMGVTVAIDDFGTGYSSLAYLRRFQIDTLKIDGSFVRDLGEDAGDSAIVSAIIAMAASLKLNVIAEGVETRTQADRLIELGCRRMQGYLFGRALPASDIPALIASLGSSSHASAARAERDAPLRLVHTAA